MSPTVTSIDHIVLTVARIPETLAFYGDVLGMTPETFRAADGTTRHALFFGDTKINLHQEGHEFEPKARHARPGTADLCFLTQTPLDTWTRHLVQCGITIEDGPVPRSGATGPITSLYLRDPDDNLIEISTRVP